jgi:L-2-hydroxyglutarate oxidase
MTDTGHDVAIIGGGCIGCSIAKHLGENTSLDVCVVEKEYNLAAHQSGRNSGVLHPGFNYEPGSLKAQFSTQGTTRMKQYCRENDIPIDEYGVVVVAEDSSDVDRLHELQEQANENGVETSILDQEALHEHEPHAAGQMALYCPEAASVDAQQYVHTLARDAVATGTEFYMGYEVTDIESTKGHHTIETSKGTLTATYVVNAAGLYADHLAHEMGVGQQFRVIPFRGEYYELRPEARSLVNTMIYPTPDPDLPFLGVHFTRRSDDKVIVGPNAVLAFGRESYRNTDVNVQELREILTYAGFWRLIGSKEMLSIAWDELNKSFRKEEFVAGAQQLVPAAQQDDFVPSYAGVRAQLVSSDGDLVGDPTVEHGLRSTHVLNAVSPGLTSSLPFGEHVSEMVSERIDESD